MPTRKRNIQLKAQITYSGKSRKTPDPILSLILISLKPNSKTAFFPSEVSLQFFTLSFPKFSLAQQLLVTGAPNLRPGVD